MSYHRYKRPYYGAGVRAVPRRPRAMSGILDTILGSSALLPPGVSQYGAVGQMWNAIWGSASVDQKKCLDQANASPQVAKIDAATAELAKTWNIAGRITVADMTNMAAWVGAQNISAQVALVGAPRASSDGQTVIAMAMNALARNNERVKTWNAAIASATAQGVRVIEAPTFKKDVLNALVNISQAYVTTAVMYCNITWLDRAGAAVDEGVARARQIADVALALAEKVIKVAGATFDLAAWLGTYGPWAAVGLGALYLWSKGKHAS